VKEKSMAFVVRECPGEQYSVTGLDEFDQPIGSWAELVAFAKSVLATDAALHTLSPAAGSCDCDCEGGDGVPHRRGSGDCRWC
jgi:hypothetical protein